MENPIDLTDFYNLRAKVFEVIERHLKTGRGFKSYEGGFEIQFPQYFDSCWYIRLDCFILGPERHYEWEGDTFEEALKEATKDITKWIEEYNIDDALPD